MRIAINIQKAALDLLPVKSDFRECRMMVILAIMRHYYVSDPSIYGGLLASWHLKSARFDFVGAIAAGSVLLVGEGNLSFTESLITKNRIRPTKLTATTFSNPHQLLPSTLERANKLNSVGVQVMHGVDATELYRKLGVQKFDSIVFQFPHTGSREPIGGRNPNFILLRNFLISAKYQFSPQGKILVSLVDSPHYDGAFQCVEAADIAGYKYPASYPFEPSNFSGYKHSMTNEEGDALGHHARFRTWIFEPK